ncbi:MAG TPA: Wzz/FepE/Etk N-terminal domain-containing protein, partial [Caulobacteraceae bacterium]|nr:Wzz/FepE/Etk N-terminal domain-containing protein [Caulobacteraceae bacterium]
MSTDAWTSRETLPPIGRPPPRAGWAPPYGLGDFVALLWRERFLMIGVFLVIFALGVAFSLTMKKSYQAYSSLVVQLGEEYVYNPRVGDAGRGAASSAGQIMQSELEILGSSTVKERVLQRIGLARVYPKLAKDYARANRTEQRLIWGAAIRTMQDSLKIESAPETSVVRLAFTHEDPLVAAEVLNTLVDEYMAYRKSVLIGGDGGVLDLQRRTFEARLQAADAEYQAFLAQNGIGDFDSEKASLAQVYGALMTERYSIQAQVSEADSRLGVTSRQAAAAPAEIGLYQDADPTAAAKLTALRVERQDLLSRYRPESQPVREIDQKIGALEALIQAGGAAGVAARRVGVNPVAQGLQTEKNQLEAQSTALKRRLASVLADLGQVSARRQQLGALEPRYQDLLRQRDVLATNVRALSTRE